MSTDTTTTVEHRHTGGSFGEPGACSAECACGVVFAGFDTHSEAYALVKQHIQDEAALAAERRAVNALQAIDEYWAPGLASARQRATQLERRLRTSWRKAGRVTVHAAGLENQLSAARRERDELAAFVHAVRDTLGLTDLHSATGRVLLSDTLNGARNILAALTKAQSTPEQPAAKHSYATGGPVHADQPTPAGASVDLSALVRKWQRQAVEPCNAGTAESVYDECAAELDAVLDRVRQSPPSGRPEIAIATTPAGGLPAYVDRLRASHHWLASGCCSCENPLCEVRFLLDHIDDVIRGRA